MAVIGCGGGDETEVRETVSNYLNAVADGDGQKACDQLTGDAKRELGGAIAEQVPELGVATCEDAIGELSEGIGGDETGALRDLEFESVSVEGDTARATPKGATQAAELKKVDGRWYISGGLTP